MSITIHKTRIGQIVSRQVVTVPPATPLVEAVNLMAQTRISCLVIAEKKKPLGIFTERDLVKLSARWSTVGTMPISELMTCPVVTIHRNLSLFEAYGIMLSNRIRHHVVVNSSGKIIGVMSQSDLINVLGLEYFVEMRLVEQVMTVAISTVQLEAPLREAIDRMAAAGISCVVVVNGTAPVGILTERDAVRLVATDAELDAKKVADIMSHPVLTVQLGTTVHSAAKFMRKEHIRRIVVVDEPGNIRGIITQTDIVRGLEGKYIEALKEIIREKENIFQQTAQELLDKTFYLDNILSSSIDMAIIATDSNFRIKYFNPVAEKVFHYPAAGAIGRSARELHAQAGIPDARLQRTLDIVRRRGKHAFAIRIEHQGRINHYEGSLSSILDRQKKLVGYVLMLHDVTARREQEQTIHHMAYHDALTGLPNRVLLGDRLAQALVAVKRNGSAGALMILDLDRFKDINDTLGHSTGDRLLTAVSERLTALLRKSDTVSRMGGDEFVLLLPTIASSNSAALIAAKIVRAFRKPFICNGHTLKVTASIGIANFPADGDDAETALKNADIALYRVKEQGRDGFQRFSMPT